MDRAGHGGVYLTRQLRQFARRQARIRHHNRQRRCVSEPLEESLPLTIGAVHHLLGGHVAASTCVRIAVAPNDITVSIDDDTERVHDDKRDDPQTSDDAERRALASGLWPTRDTELAARRRSGRADRADWDVT